MSGELALETWDASQLLMERIEAVLSTRNLPFDRPIESEIVTELSGQWCDLRLWLSWEPLSDVFMLTASYAQRIPEARRASLYPLLSTINEKLLMGHFEISSDDGTLFFRCSQMIKDTGSLSADLLESLLDLASVECERFYPVFQTALWTNRPTQEAIDFALMDFEGEA